jgi:UDP-glucose 4-epimerase
VYNVGTGRGTTVREVLASIERVTGMPVPHEDAPRRDGDPPELYAQASKIQSQLQWQPQWTHIDQIVETAAQWAQSPRY